MDTGSRNALTCDANSDIFDFFSVYLRVKLVDHGEGRVLAPAQGAELVMLLPGHRQEGVPTVHQITLKQIHYVKKTNKPNPTSICKSCHKSK